MKTLRDNVGIAIDGGGIEVGQARIPGDVEVDVGLGLARPGDVRREEGDEGHVAAVGQCGEVGEVIPKRVGKQVELPLVGHAVRRVGGDEQLEVAPGTLVDQRFLDRAWH